MRKLENLTAEMTYVGDLQLGCMKGSLDYLGIEVSRPWLAGVTGQAFVIGIAPDVCLSSVSACLEDEYADGTMARLGRNLGYDLEYHRFDGRDPNKRAIAWQRFQAAIDAGRPCYGYFNFCYQLYVGYDADGFYIGDGATNAGQGPFSMLDVDGDSWSLCIVGPAGSSSDDPARPRRRGRRRPRRNSGRRRSRPGGVSPLDRVHGRRQGKRDMARHRPLCPLPRACSRVPVGGREQAERGSRPATPRCANALPVCM